MNPLPDRGKELEPGIVYEVVWTSYMPFMAPCKLGKVHNVTLGTYPRTLCGVQVGPPRRRFVLSDDLDRCLHCLRVAARSAST